MGGVAGPPPSLRTERALSQAAHLQPCRDWDWIILQGTGPRASLLHTSRTCPSPPRCDTKKRPQALLRHQVPELQQSGLGWPQLRPCLFNSDALGPLVSRPVRALTTPMSTPGLPHTTSALGPSAGIAIRRSDIYLQGLM